MSQITNHIWKRGDTDAETIAASTLYSRLAEAIVWCTTELADPAVDASMRSRKIRPRLWHEGRDDLICSVGYSRHFQLNETCPCPNFSMPDLQNGKLLCYFPDDDLCDGAAEDASDGFFDRFNAPPWDTWVGWFENKHATGHYRSGFALAFVPAELVSLAVDGIEVNPEQCIQWLENTDVSLRARFTYKRSG